MAHGEAAAGFQRTRERLLSSVVRAIAGLQTLPGVLLAAAGASLVSGWLIAPQGFLAAGLVGLVLVVGICGPAANLRGVQGELIWVTSRGVEGQPVSLRLAVRNRAPWPAGRLGLFLVPLHHPAGSRSVAHDQRRANTAEAQPAVAQPAVIVEHLRGGAREEFNWTWTPPCRGIYPQVAPEWGTDFPFGLRLARRSLSVQGQTIVWPRTVELSLPWAPSSWGWGQWMSGKIAGDDGETLGIRPFQQGDSLRAIHWPATSRWGEFYVRERQRSVALHASIVVAGSVGPWSEDVVRVMASLGKCWLRHQIPFRCLGAGWNSRWCAPAQTERQWLDWCAGWEAPSGPLSRPASSANSPHTTPRVDVSVTASPAAAALRPREDSLGTDLLGVPARGPAESLRVWIVVDAAAADRLRASFGTRNTRRSESAGDVRNFVLHITADEAAIEACGARAGSDWIVLDARRDVLAELAHRWPALVRESVHAS